MQQHKVNMRLQPDPPARTIAEECASKRVRNFAFNLCSPVIILSQLAREGRCPVGVLIPSRISGSLQGASSQADRDVLLIQQ